MIPSTSEDVVHRFKNHLAIVIGFGDLLVEAFEHDDPRLADVLEIQKSARAAMALLPELARRAQGDPE